MSAAITLPPGVQLCHLPSSFTLASGSQLPGAVVAYERTGVTDGPVVVVLGGISADRHPGNWWRETVGEGRAIDTERFNVLSIDWLGGAGCSTSPAGGERFPFIATSDQADALAHVLGALKIERLHALVGSSYGGMVGLQFAARHANRLERLIAIAAADYSHPQASAWRAVQRGIVTLGRDSGAEREALSLARALAMTTYRTAVELADRFVGPASFEDGVPRFPVEDWLTARGRVFADQFTVEQFLCLNSSIDAHRIEPSTVSVKTALISFDSDQLVPASDVRRLAAGLPALQRHVELATRYGHDGFLKETAAVGRVLREVLQ